MTSRALQLALSDSAPRINVRRYGAWGKGGDYTTALQTAIADQQAIVNASTFGGGITSNAKPWIELPAGVYGVSADLSTPFTNLDGVAIRGEPGTIIELSSGVTMMSKIRNMFDMEYVSVRGGAGVIVTAPTGTQMSQISLKRVEMHQQSGRMIYQPSGGALMTLHAMMCKFVSDSTAALILEVAGGDYLTFDDCRMRANTSAGAAFKITDAQLKLMNCVGEDGLNLMAWFDLYGSAAISAFRLRCGAENGGPSDSVVIYHGSGSWTPPITARGINLDRCELYTTGSVIHLYGIPNLMEISHCTCTNNTQPLKLESSIPAADIINLGFLFNAFHVEFNATAYNLYALPGGTASVTAGEKVGFLGGESHTSTQPDIADLLLQVPGQTAVLTPVYNQNSQTITTPSDELGTVVRRAACTADIGSFTWELQTALTGFAAGHYTAVFDFTVLTDMVMLFDIYANTVTIQKRCGRGRHCVSLPFYFDGGTNKIIGLAAYWQRNGSSAQWEQFRLYRGRWHIKDKMTQLLGNAAPGAVTNVTYKAGDSVRNTAPVASGIREWVRTTQGTWKTVALSA